MNKLLLPLLLLIPLVPVTTEASASPASTAIVVMGARINDNGTIPPILAHRLTRATNLAKGNPHVRVVATGGRTGPHVEADVMRGSMMKRGIAGRRILKERTSHSTYDNAIKTSRLLRKMKVNRIYLVTTDWHMSRAVAEFRQAYPGLTIIQKKTRS